MSGKKSVLNLLMFGIVTGSLVSPAQVVAQAGTRPAVELQCVSFGIGPMLECVVTIKRRDGTPVQGAQVKLGALMPSMPMAHTIKPAQSVATGRPGEYRGTIELEMLGVWSVDIDISGPVREKISRNLLITDCNEGARCVVPPAKPGDEATPMGRHKGPMHKH
jgi:hypothetical protein